MVRILFVHPDLGIGGAERLVVDAALALQSKGHTVRFLTNHHDPEHCFDETKDGRLQVMTVGDWLPRDIFGKFYAVCAYIRMVYAAFYYSLFLSKKEPVDVVFCDLISLGIPIFRLARPNPKILFYCHYPDQLLSKPGNLLKQCYRMPLNYLEEVTTAQADGILVNSKFTSRVFKETFKRISTDPDVLYPSLNTRFFDESTMSESDQVVKLPKDAFVFLSINRYERKKNLPLALHSLKALQERLSPMEWNKVCLIMAGGYDDRVLENVEHYDELEELAEDMQIRPKVRLLKSPTDRQKLYLLHRAQALIYTPEFEHFGIVPLEGMYLSKPVIAANSGGPTETIIHEQTGFLCEPLPSDFASAMAKLVKDERYCERMGDMGRKRVQQRFSFEAFSTKLDNIVVDLIQNDAEKKAK
ncbi:alpha-1,3/1,6-mannosyltransferase ALG2 [Anopheles ziemanni]|uniref:alpha-1,3/1,6-mannosyltransferase ALG2 n=1 Tax=Anopheles coustani TaxID=139045 RepID=UPI00265832AF|nr:alpha-1,3/1,6-mannosyltransferase ALG2 [Anopheles coustani]XP_058171811.1 alpha-1,3/1,6-mannosyltransferase ALG2 [Anopheles ziemanni]